MPGAEVVGDTPTLRHRARVRAGARTVHVAVTDRSVDLSEPAGADQQRLDRELGRVRAATGLPVARMHQVHGADVAACDREPDQPPRVDALVTTAAGLVLMARAADCVPVLLADRAGACVAAVHCGRGGLVAGVVPAAVSALRERGAADVVAWLGPHVCGSCYEVPAELRDEVAAAVPRARSQTSWGTPALDLGAGVRAQLAAAGCGVAGPVGTQGCTIEDAAWPSYRRDGAGSTRFAGLVWLEEGPGDGEEDG